MPRDHRAKSYHVLASRECDCVWLSRSTPQRQQRMRHTPALPVALCLRTTRRRFLPRRSANITRNRWTSHRCQNCDKISNARGDICRSFQAGRWLADARKYGNIITYWISVDASQMPTFTFNTPIISDRFKYMHFSVFSYWITTHPLHDVDKKMPNRFFLFQKLYIDGATLIIIPIKSKCD